MKKSKFQKVQLWLSIVPIYSTIFIMLVTYYTLWKRKEKLKNWLFFFLIVVLSIALPVGVNSLMSGRFLILNVLITAGVGLIPNMLLVELQTMKPQTTTPASVEKTESTKSVIVPYKRLLFVSFLVFIVIFAFVYVGNNLYNIFKEHEKNTIPDINGADNYALAVLTDEDVLRVDEDYTMLWYGETQNGNQSEISDLNLVSHDYDSLSFSASSVSGIKLFHATKTSANSLKLQITSSVESGNLAIYVLVDGEIYANVPIDDTQEIILKDIQGKIILVKIAAEDAKIRVEVIRSFDEA